MDHTRTDENRLITFVYMATKEGWSLNTIKTYISQHPYEFAER